MLQCMVKSTRVMLMGIWWAHRALSTEYQLANSLYHSFSPATG